MNEQEWRAARDSRSLRYAGRVLDPEHWVLLRADAAYIARYDGQVAVLTAANLLARMTPAVVLDISAAPLVAPLPWAGRDLKDCALQMMFETDPYGRFTCRDAREGDYLLQLGPDGGPFVAHGSGWNIYLGPPPSPIRPADAPNVIGPALAAILATAGAFSNNLAGTPDTVVLNALNWRHSLIEPGTVDLPTALSLGDMWTAGTGSVGTAILYFLTLATRQFSTTLFDMDVVKIHNLDRSPLFLNRHVGMAKVDATLAWLRDAGLRDVRHDVCALDESQFWRRREAGTPDLVIATANERKVRAVIETGFPPIQIYGTTGKHWQAAVIRHIPLRDPCSSCLFAEADYAPAQCATGDLTTGNGEERVDAALPFLSFGAGAMAAAEILKLNLPGYPFAPNRVVLNTRPDVRAIRVALARRDSCICRHRSRNVHRKMIAGSRFAELTS